VSHWLLQKKSSVLTLSAQSFHSAIQSEAYALICFLHVAQGMRIAFELDDRLDAGVKIQRPMFGIRKPRVAAQTGTAPPHRLSGSSPPR
jgi:hypothetical protein